MDKQKIKILKYDDADKKAKNHLDNVNDQTFYLNKSKYSVIDISEAKK